jgi:hypothetical protein
MMLKRSLQTPEGRELFVSLFACWTHNPVAALSLCLLAQVRSVSLHRRYIVGLTTHCSRCRSLSPARNRIPVCCAGARHPFKSG